MTESDQTSVEPRRDRPRRAGVDVAILGDVAESAVRGSDLFPHLVEVACDEPAIRSSLDDWVRHRRAPLPAILRRGPGRGELPADADLELLPDAMIGPFVDHRLPTRGDLDAAFVGRRLALVPLSV